jgi:hypothetical protein
MLALPCGHQMHHRCCCEWFAVSNTCPLCRRSFPQLPAEGLEGEKYPISRNEVIELFVKEANCPIKITTYGLGQEVLRGAFDRNQAMSFLEELESDVREEQVEIAGCVIKRFQKTASDESGTTYIVEAVNILGIPSRGKKEKRLTWFRFLPRVAKQQELLLGPGGRNWAAAEPWVTYI